MPREGPPWFGCTTAVTSGSGQTHLFPHVTKDITMIPLIPDFLWLREYAERLNTRRAPEPERPTAALQPTFWAIR